MNDAYLSKARKRTTSVGYQANVTARKTTHNHKRFDGVLFSNNTMINHGCANHRISCVRSGLSFDQSERAALAETKYKQLSEQNSFYSARVAVVIRTRKTGWAQPVLIRTTEGNTASGVGDLVVLLEETRSATVRAQLDGVRLFGRRCVLYRQPRRRPCGTSSTEFNSSVGGACSTVSPGGDRAGPARSSSVLRSWVQSRP